MSGHAAAAAIVLVLAGAMPAAAQGLAMPGRDARTPIEVVARDGIEWRQKERVYIARGNARATQGEVSVFADALAASYRQNDSGPTQIYRLEAAGNVRIVSTTRTAYGNRAVYDVDEGVIVLTGSPRLVTPEQSVTARDSIEYWDRNNMAVARGNAVAVGQGRTLRAEVITAHFTRAASGETKLSRVDAVSNVLITTETETVRGERGVYDLDSGIARLSGGVSITRGENQLTGATAEVNLVTGVSRLVGDGASGVRGLLVPREVQRNAPPGRGG
ncbi:MAG: hypothetical protein FJX67_18115 [Alphaproteobacteria bacterium]|nr:hypothetical protein [Alphaproteobacteria bacterium]